MGIYKKFFCAVFILFFVSTAFAAVPRLINYQGRLTDASGNPLTGSYNITFRIYDAETAGSLLWEETQTGVVIDKGLFGVLLGSVASLNIPFDKAYFLEIKVGAEVMSPRQRITSSGYAIRAEVAETVSGIDPGMVGTKTVDETGLSDGMVTYYDNASGKVKYKTVPKTTLGSWDATKTKNTVYQAATDGFVVAYGPVNNNKGYGDNPWLHGLTDGNNPPVTKRASCDFLGGWGTDNNTIMTFTMPVRKGDYWKVTTVGNATVYWISLGN
ncbi:MAG TPA: hypothetical protein DCL35_05555 [Candidatus Omnitrophica bacterium]|nr:hypothetical protein [Candidatus Omnitrophota bacterium]